MNIHAIGIVRSPYTSRAQCPKQAGDNDPETIIEIADQYLPAMSELQPGQQIIVLTWLHLGDRSVLTCHPRGDEERPIRGVFATRSPDRPNPIGHHTVTITKIEDNQIYVHPMEVIDGTPVIDIKSDFGTQGSPLHDRAQNEAARKILHIGRDAWTRGLFNGMNGNISVRMDSRILITGTGSAKGHLCTVDLTLMERATQKIIQGPPPSSETPVHLAIYARQPAAQAVLHTHCPHLLALSLQINTPMLQELPLFEGQVFAHKLTHVPPLTPGTPELGTAVGEASVTHQCIFMENHGLVVWGKDLVQALALTEELESLAHIQLMCMPSSDNE